MVVDQMSIIAGVASANGIPEVMSRLFDFEVAVESTALEGESAYAVEDIPPVHSMACNRAKLSHEH